MTNRAANSLSDIFAMGGRPDCAKYVVSRLTWIRPKVIAAIFARRPRQNGRGGLRHHWRSSIRNPEPIYGLAVTGMVDVAV